MASIYQKALGADFDLLHPIVQRRLGLQSTHEEAFIGRGHMELIWNAGLIVWPILWWGKRHHILFPEKGKQIPFTIENYAYKDAAGLETVAWLRSFRFPSVLRRFDAWMQYDDPKGIIMDYLGTHQHLVVDIRMQVTETGGFTLSAIDQRYRNGVFRFPLPSIFSAKAYVSETYDENADVFRIQVTVRNPLVGTIFQYKGFFKGEFVPCKPHQLPLYAKPLRP